MAPDQQRRSASPAEHGIGRDGHDQAESRPGRAGEDDGRRLAEHPPCGRRAEPFDVAAHQSTVVGYMEDMTGRWAWRGNRRGEGDNPAPRAHGGAPAGDSAEAAGPFDRRAATGETRRVTGGPHDGTGGPRGGAGGAPRGARGTAHRGPRGVRAPADPPPPPGPPLPPLPPPRA